MLSPTETVKKDDRVVEGRLASVGDGFIELALVGTDYRLKLAVTRPVNARVGDKIRGVIRAQARRIDIVPAGGRYVEPVTGRPRRVQGRVVAIDEKGGALIVAAGPPIALRLNAGQRVEAFEAGQLVSTDVEPGAAFTPEPDADHSST